MIAVAIAAIVSLAVFLSVNEIVTAWERIEQRKLELESEERRLRIRK